MAHSIELISSMASRGGQVWTLRHVYVCAREWSGGENLYEKKTKQGRKIPSKKTGCPCRIVIKCYPGTKVVLGRYENRHDHPIGIANAPFMCLTTRSREQMRAMVMQKIDPREIVRKTLPFSRALLIGYRYTSSGNQAPGMAEIDSLRSAMSAG